MMSSIQKMLSRGMMVLMTILIWATNSNNALVQAQQQQDPTTMNGGSILAMAGKECVAVAVDKRFGSGPQMVNIAPRHVWTPNSNVMVAFVGLEGDVQSLSQTASSPGYSMAANRRFD